SIEAHGPYNRSYGIDLEARNAIPVPDAIQGDHREHPQNYIYHIRHADQAPGQLVKALDKRKRRTIVLIYGDHLPALAPAHPDARPGKRDVAAWELRGMVLARAGISHTPYFALTDIVGPKLYQLTRAPDAPRVTPTAEQKRIEHGLRNVSQLRLEGKLKPLWDKVTTRPASTTSTATTGATQHKSRETAATKP